LNCSQASKAIQVSFNFGGTEFSCELGCSELCGVDMDAISERLLTSGAFTSNG